MKISSNLKNAILFLTLIILPLISNAKTDYQCPVTNPQPSTENYVSVLTASDFDEIDYGIDFNPGILSVRLTTNTISSDGLIISTKEEVLYGRTFLGGLEVDRMACGYLGSPDNTYTGYNKKFIVSDMCRIKSTSSSPFNKVSLMLNLVFKTGGSISIDVLGEHPETKKLILGACN